MKRLSKMAYELRDVTIFFERMVNENPVREIAMIHNRSVSRINQILKKQIIQFKNSYFVENDHLTIQLSLLSKYLMQDYYHYEIGLILQRYYIRMKNVLS
ncbi:MAG: hypothetical protein GWP19_05010 [Planctomycetia bacterium]|nr:hypothetical protein [Planctomycetia bacterium]